jgi:hypothetical protein
MVKVATVQFRDPRLSEDRSEVGSDVGEVAGDRQDVVGSTKDRQ